MYIKFHTIAILATSLLASTLNAITVDHYNSLVVAPALENTVVVRGPLFIGVVKDIAGKAIKKKRVAIWIDKRLVGVVQTNKYGVWSYRLGNAQALQDGTHLIQAYVQLDANRVIWMRASLFDVNASRMPEGHRSGNVNTTNSVINFPFDSSSINTSTPTLVGSLVDSNHYAVVGETVQIKINGVNIATVTSDSNGIFSYQVSSALDDGNYTIDAHCVQTNVNLATNSFTVDTAGPDAPIISTPLDGGTETTSTVIVSGTTEAHATITTYLDESFFGDVSYADESGNWSIEYVDLSNGSHTVAADTTDLAQNTSSVSDLTSFTVSA
jgi:large repetitive protein